MILRRLEFVMREMALALVRHPLMTFAAVSSAAAALAIVGGAALLWFNLNRWGEQVLSEVQVTAYLRRYLPRPQAMVVYGQVRSWPEVRRAAFVTQEELLERLQRRLGSNPGLLRLNPNPLPDAIEVQTVDAEQVRGLARRLVALPDVERVISAQTTLRTLLTMRRVVRLIGLVGGGLLALGALVIISNTIRLTLFARRREISIMQMVGATDRFVAAPFVLEGVAHGLSGALVACAILIPGYLALARAWQNHLPAFPPLPQRDLVDLAIALVAAGVLFGAAASLASVGRFLRHQPII